MLPSSVLGLAIFVLLLAPGFVYVLRRERSVPARQHSPFRETVRVVAVSLVCLAIAGLMVAAARALWPRYTLNFGGLVHDPVAFTRVHYVQLAWWSIAFLALATMFGAVAADPRLARRARSAAGRRPLRWLAAAASTDIQQASAWYIVMHMYDHDPGPIDVGAQLDDGSYVRGRLSYFSAKYDETADRDLLLQAPLDLTTADGKTVPLGSQYMVVSARRLIRLDVTHLPPETDLSGLRDSDQQHAE